MDEFEGNTETMDSAQSNTEATDGFQSNMRSHATNIFQSQGIGLQGAQELAEGQRPSNPIDQAMLGSYDAQNNSCLETIKAGTGAITGLAHALNGMDNAARVEGVRRSLATGEMAWLNSIGKK